MPNRFLLTLGFVVLAAGARAPAAAKVDRFGGTVTASVGVSEWAPPDQLSLDLTTGRYRLTGADPRQSAPAGRYGAGRLDRVRLQRVREAVRAARDGGLTERACSSGGPPPRLVISNAVGPRILILSRPGRPLQAPRDRGCWTVGAIRLGNLLEDIFGPLAQLRRRQR